MEELQNPIHQEDILNVTQSPNPRINDNSKIIEKKTFTLDFMTSLKDSNAYGNNYFAKYFEWQGVCRETWFFTCIASDFLKSIGVLITKSAFNEYKKETFPFQKIRCLLNTREIKNASFYLDFRFCDPEDDTVIFSQGYQKIVFADLNRKIIKFPLYILDKVKEYSL